MKRPSVLRWKEVGVSGLSRVTSSTNDVYVKTTRGRLPWKWMAITIPSNAVPPEEGTGVGLEGSNAYVQTPKACDDHLTFDLRVAGSNGEAPPPIATAEGAGPDRGGDHGRVHNQIRNVHQ